MTGGGKSSIITIGDTTTLPVPPITAFSPSFLFSPSSSSALVILVSYFSFIYLVQIIQENLR